MASIDTLIPDIEKLFNGSNLNRDNLASFAVDIASNFENRFKGYGDENEPYLRMSNVGKPLRQLWYTVKSGLTPEPLRASDKFKFLYGDIIEDLVLLLAVEAGHEVTDFQKEVEVDGVRGRIDCRIDGVLVDVKSASSRSFGKFKDGTLLYNDPFGYVAQLAGYATALGDDSAAFLAIDKTLGHICLLKLSAEDIQQYDVRQKIAVAREALALDTPPVDKCYQPVPDGTTKDNPFGNGNYVLATGCSYCPYKEHCWTDANEGKGLRTFIYSTGPKYFTSIKTGKTPRVHEVKNDPE